MPTSDLDWSSFPSGPIFQVYGTKRKAGHENPVDMTDHDTKQLPEQHAKRLCQWNGYLPQATVEQPASIFSQDTVFQDNNNTLLTAPLGPGSIMEVNHNSLSMQDLHRASELHQPQQLSHPALSHVMSQQPPRVPSPWPSHQAAHALQTVDHVMDINDETFSPSLPDTADMESACMAMDDDLTPDPQQYTAPSNNNSPQSTTNSEFCESFCGGGEPSPRSGRVRCYCKPSWEGMLDMKPYTSDVY